MRENRRIGAISGRVVAALLAGLWAAPAVAQNASPPAAPRNAAPPEQHRDVALPAQPAEAYALTEPVYRPSPPRDESATPPASTYRPPLRGAPDGRGPGATRSGNAAHAAVFVLAPEATGYSMSTAPTLYWYFLTGARGKMQVTVTQDGVAKPILDVVLDAPAGPGIFSLSLADRRVTLLRGVEYQWSVALITDPARRERDVVASARLICVAPPAGVQQRLAAATPLQRTAILADASLWYDALTAAAAAIPAFPAARLHRAALLDQVGLKDAAAFDRAR